MNRPDVLRFVVRQFDKFCPKHVKIITIDDNSDDPDANRKSAEQIGEYYYNDERQGIANSKNKCICLLDTDRVFLFDDDCFPVKENWFDTWVGEDHMSYACEPNINIESIHDQLVWWSGTFGCCLYFTRKALDDIGGFDNRFGLYGYEHAELTQRINRYGITPHPYICPSDPGVWSFDAQGSYGGFKWDNKSSMTNQEKADAIEHNEVIYASINNK